MADIEFLGTATAVAQVTTATPANVEATDIFSLLIDGEVIATFTATDTSVATTVTGLFNAWEASTDPRALLITAVDNTTHLTLTSTIAGLPFTVTSTAVDGGGTDTQTLAIATTTASAGPNHWGTAANWSTGSIPTTGDNVRIADSAVNICWDLDQSAVDLNNLDILDSYTGLIGLNKNGVAVVANGGTVNTAKREYREDYLKIGYSGNCSIGRSEGSRKAPASGRIKIYNPESSGAATTDVYNNATSVDPGKPATRLRLADGAANVTIHFAPGGVGFGVEDINEVSTQNNVYVLDRSGATKVFFGNSCNTDELHTWGGSTIFRNDSSAVAAIYQFGGDVLAEGGYLVSLWEIYDGNGVANNTGSGASAITNVKSYGGILNGIQSAVARTWDTLTRRTGGTVLWNADVVTITTVNGTHAITDT